MRQPPRTSCPVYVWDWNDDEPPKFVRMRIRNNEREETLNSHSDEQKKYNAFNNEWDCCREWGEDPDDDDYVEPLPEHLQPPKTADDLKAERLAREVGRLLYEYYGWVVPIPLPDTDNISIREENRKSLIAVLGLQTVLPSSPFFNTPLAKAAIGFIKLLAGKETARPSADEWNLMVENRLSLTYTHTLGSIRAIRQGEEVWYMFDFGLCRTVPWNLAVPTAVTALMVCCLKERLDETMKDRLDETMKDRLDETMKDRLDESAVARELVLEGVRFHTILRHDVLECAEPEVPTLTFLPMRLSDHVFNKRDHDFYCRQCREILSSPRAWAALMRGGFIWRLALEFMDPSEAL
jgi:hypothetical protein